jgi:small redox-active disulfide protein 2
VIIKVLGPGCRSCVTLERVTREAVEALGINATVEKVEDYRSIAGYGVMSTPALVIDERVIFAGRVPSPKKVRKLITTANAGSPTPLKKEQPMPAIHVFEPALCCNTGVCGPDVDQALVVFTADLNHLQELGADVQRHNLANDPSAFAASDTVRAFLQVAGSDGLPLTLVDGLTVMTGAYPAREQLMRYAGLGAESPESTAPQGVTELGLTEKSGGCCGPSGCC